jgi:hypothetical protein
LSWTKTQKVFAGVGALIAASSSMAGTIVIRASGPSAKAFPVGKTLAEGQRVALKTGDTLVLLDPKGTRTLTGAGNFEVGTAANGAQAPSAFKALIANAGTRQVRTGAVRGANAGPVRVASLWYVDTSKGGTVCLKDPLQANLWRADMSQPVTVTLSSAGVTVQLTFGVGQAVKPWPIADMPLKMNTEYRISAAGMASPTVIRFVPFTQTSAAPDDVAKALIEQGCSAQLEALVEAGKSPETSG